MELPLAESRALLLVGIALLLGGYSIATYNGLAAQRRRVASSWSQVAALLQRRGDRIAALADLAAELPGEASAARAAIERARQAAQAAGADVAARAAAESDLARAARQLLATVEAAPELRANQRLALLRAELASTERELALAWRRYEDAALGYDTVLESFPASVLAGRLGFRPAPRFALERVAEYGGSATGAGVAPQ